MERIRLNEFKEGGFERHLDSVIGSEWVGGCLDKQLTHVVGEMQKCKGLEESEGGEWVVRLESLYEAALQGLSQLKHHHQQLFKRNTLHYCTIHYLLTSNLQSYISALAHLTTSLSSLSGHICPYSE